MARPSIYRLLEKPGIYRLVQAVLAPGSRRLERENLPEIRLNDSGWLLDVGSGPGTGTPRGSWRAVGVDPNPDYIRQFSGGYVDVDSQEMFAQPSKRRSFGFVASAAALPFADGSFDLVRCSRVFHHLPDSVAEETVREMVRVAKPGGEIVIIDPILPNRGWQRPMAWVLLKCDRGEFVRREERLLNLVHRAHSGTWTHRKILCSYLGVQSLVLQLAKPTALARAA